MNIKQLKEKHEKLMAEAEKLGAQIAEMKDDEEWPQTGDEHWWLTADGDILFDSWSDGEIDNNCLAMGNAFRTEAEAKKEVDRRKVLTKLRAMTNGFVPDWRQTIQAKWFIVNDSAAVWSISSANLNNFLCPAYFATRADAQAAIDELGDDLMVLL